MPKVSGPLMSATASGLIGERLIFSKRATGQQARFQRAQKDFSTVGRTTQRALYAAAVAAWNVLDDDILEIWRDLSLLLDMTGYNLFVKSHLNGEILDADYSYYGDRNYGIFTYGKT
jgi:hypothetical protein